MPSTQHLNSLRLRFVTAALLLHLMVVVVLSVAPDLHALLHGHSHDEEHICAVTLFRGGGVDVATTEVPVAGALRWVCLPGAMPVESPAISLALMGKTEERGPPGNRA